MKRISTVLKVALILVMAAGLIGVMTSCGPKEEAGGDQAKAQQEEKSVIDNIMERGVIKVGVGVFTPWAFKDKDGNLIGFEIDVATKLAEDMGVEVEFVPTQWSGIIPALLTGKFDVIIGGMTITPERALKVNFSRPYDYAIQDMAANIEMCDNGSWDSIEDFNKEDVVFAIRMGSTAKPTAQRLFPKAEIREFDDEGKVVQEILNGNAHGWVSAAPKPFNYVNQYSDTLYRPFGGESLRDEPIGFALRPGDLNGLRYFDSWIQIHMDTGWLPDKHDYWFDSDAWMDQVE